MQASATRSPIPSRLATGVPWTRLWGICYWKSKSAQEHFLWRATSYNYIYVCICKSRVRSIRRFTYIYPIFVPSWQAATYSRIAHTRLMWMSDINVNFRNCFLLLDYLFTSCLISSSLKKLIIALIFTKIYQIHQKTLKMKDGRILNKIINSIDLSSVYMKKRLKLYNYNDF